MSLLKLISLLLFACVYSFDVFGKKVNGQPRVYMPCWLSVDLLNRNLCDVWYYFTISL